MSEEIETPTVQADSEALEGRTLDILYGLRRETTEAYRELLATRYTDAENAAYRTFVACLTTEISFVEPALRRTGHFSDKRLGTVDHRGGEVVFDGLASVLQHSDGIEVVVEKESPGRTANVQHSEETIPIPKWILKNAYRTLTDWYADVGLGVQLDDSDEWEI